MLPRCCRFTTSALLTEKRTSLFTLNFIKIGAINTRGELLSFHNTILEWGSLLARKPLEKGRKDVAIS